MKSVHKNSIIAAGTPSLESAKETAKDVAKNIIERKFKEPASLEDIREMRQEYRRKLEATEAQLSSVVRSRLDGVKRARDIIQDSATAINLLHGQFAQMEDLSRDCRGLFGKFDRIKALHHARHNLAITARLVEFFFSIPQKSLALMAQLRDDPRQLKYVWEETTKLDHWRTSFLTALKEYGDRAMTRATFQKGRAGADPLKFQVVVEKVGPQLSVVKELSQALRAQVVESIAGRKDANGNWMGGGCVELAMTEPALLVRTLEVAQLISARAKRTWEAARKQAILAGEDPENAVAGLEAPEAMKDQVLAGLKDGITLKIIGQFSALQMNSVDAGESHVMASLGAATSLLVDLESVEELVAPCFPPQYEIMSVFRKTYQNFLEDILYPLVSSDDRIQEYDVKDLLEAIKWLEYFNKQVDRNERFASAVVNLNKAYLSRIKSQILQWVHNLKAQPVEAMQTSEGKWFTTFPDDMFNLINIQISVAKTLPIDFLGSVLVACLEVLHEVQRESMEWILQNWQHVSGEEGGVELMCSIVNDNIRLQEKSDEFVTDMAAPLPYEEKEKLAGKMDEVSGGYIEVAMLATSKISLYIMTTLESADIIAQIFGPLWETGSFESMKTITETYGDFFRDLSQWLPDFFFAKLVRISYEHIIKTYIEAMLNPTRKPVASVSRAVTQIDEDKQLLCDFFNTETMPHLGQTLGEVLQQAGLTSSADIEAQFQMWNDLQVVFSAETMDQLQLSTTQATIKRLVAEFKSTSMYVIMQILALQKKWPGDEAKQRKEFVERLVKICGHLAPDECSMKYILHGYVPIPTKDDKSGDKSGNASGSTLKWGSKK